MSQSSGSSEYEQEHEEEHEEDWYGHDDEHDDYGDVSVAGDRFGQAVVIAARAGRGSSGTNGAVGQKGAGAKQFVGGGGGASAGGGVVAAARRVRRLRARRLR
ncbi:hypothetical protein BCR44DRAFT_1012116 [Catenaria anguillulae PL171]|uniref:Uncharacterized protein n=1 Tax=Catenaria anguillulae PL171 TaxID=765915 RepID=A0A1Y2I4A2_9FUNG|nr:hypothetical protein BCR44DRAFT_1012116 [Catenaria anguillulae PL171]